MTSNLQTRSIQVKYVSAPCFSGKSEVFEYLSDNCYNVVRSYDDSRKYKDIYLVNNSLVVNLDSDHLHHLELVSLDIIKDVYNQLVMRHEKLGHINRVLLVGHLRTDGDYFVEPGFAPEDNDRDSDKLFTLRCRLHQEYSDWFYREQLSEVLDSDEFISLLASLFRFKSIFKRSKGN